jgi:hypothetical protein
VVVVEVGQVVALLGAQVVVVLEVLAVIQVVGLLLVV